MTGPRVRSITNSITQPILANSGCGTSGGKLQSLGLHVFVDNSIIEIYANGVFCLTTRIYPVADDADEIGYLVKRGNADYGEVMIWDGLDRAWPERPIDSSVPLISDNAEVTNN